MKSTSKPIVVSVRQGHGERSWNHYLSGVKGIFFTTLNTPLDDPFVALSREVSPDNITLMDRLFVKGIKK